MKNTTTKTLRYTVTLPFASREERLARSKKTPMQITRGERSQVRQGLIMLTDNIGNLWGGANKIKALGGKITRN